MKQSSLAIMAPDFESDICFLFFSELSTEAARCWNSSPHPIYNGRADNQVQPHLTKKSPPPRGANCSLHNLQGQASLEVTAVPRAATVDLTTCRWWFRTKTPRPNRTCGASKFWYQQIMSWPICEICSWGETNYIRGSLSGKKNSFFLQNITILFLLSLFHRTIQDNGYCR